MKIIPRPFNGRNYWEKKGYTLLDGAVTSTGENRRRNTQVIRISTGKKKRFVWRVKRAPKVLIRAAACPRKMWNKFRDAYVNIMLRFAGRIGNIHGGPMPHFEDTKMIERARSTKKNGKKLDEFETRLVLEIYKALSTSCGLSEAVI